MQLLNEVIYEEKKSKFMGFLYEVDTEDEVENILKQLHSTHKKARHFPYAYKIDNLIRKSDDKEPNNTAGMPIYNILEKRNMNHALIVIVRYFGGIKLGAGGLYRAYNKTASDLTKDV